MNFIPQADEGESLNNEESKPPWHIALLANLKADFSARADDPQDAGAEFDSLETIQAITQALESEGHQVTFLPADPRLPLSLANLRPDICFNIAEGLGGDGREAQVPALCELLKIPYTGSRVVSNAIALDKALTKRVWNSAGLPTADFIEATSIKDLEKIAFDFPMFVKPAREGSGMGITPHSIIRDQQDLIEQTAFLLEQYHQPILIEEFLPGREFTIGFIGNPGRPANRCRFELYEPDGYHFFPVLEIDSNSSVSPAVYGHQAKSKQVGSLGAPGYLCPASISSDLESQLKFLARQAAEAIGACDVSRVDIRLDRQQQPRLMEINTLPGLTPGYSDLCIQASAESMPYQTLISEILYLAAERYQLPLPDITKSYQGRNLKPASLITTPIAEQSR